MQEIVMRKIHIYIVGVTLLGLLYSPIKDLLGHSSAFVVAAVAYLIALRFIAEKFGKP